MISMKNPEVKLSPIDFFHYCYQQVPAYKKFIDDNGLDVGTIKNLDDFHKIPITTKENYILQNSVQSLCLNGELTSIRHIASSSGSSGNSLYWPRNAEAEEISLAYFKEIYEKHFDSKNKSTLVINCFALGAWVAGFEFYNAAKTMAASDTIVVTTPGPDMVEAIKMVNNLASQFDQAILCGYPPFIKDIIEYGIQEQLNWSEFNIKLMMAGEPVSETWREHVSRLVGCKTSDILNIYGMAEAGIIGYETAETIDYRTKKELPEGVTSLYTYDPDMRFIERNEKDSHLLITTRSGIPLIRYDTKDLGGLIQASETKHLVYLFGRLDSAVTIYGVNIYADIIKDALHSYETALNVTGKFTLEQVYDDNQDQRFRINIEMGRSATKDMQVQKKLGDIISNKLIQGTSEYRKLVSMIGDKAQPLIELKNFGEIGYVPGRKHKWVKRV